MKKIVLIIASIGYQDKEYNDTKMVLEQAGFFVETISSKIGEAIGKLGGKIKIEKTINNIGSADFDALVFIGGPGANEYFNNKRAHELARMAMNKNKILAAICIAPVILAEAGILKDKKATVWHSVFDRTGIDFLHKGKAIYDKGSVVIDGSIITANGPEAAVKFGEAIVKSLMSANITTNIANNS